MSNNEENNKIEKKETSFKSGFVSLLGFTNVGKSSILNAFIGEKIAAIANRPQTTRTAIRGILTTKESQIIFVDTPGIHKSHSKLGDTMIDTAYKSSKDVDAILFVADCSLKGNIEKDREIIEKLKENNNKKPVILAINKIDLIDKKSLANLIKEYSSLYDFKAIVPVSTRKKENLDVLHKEIENSLKPGPMYYDEEEYTDQTVRDIVEETVREKALKLLQDEVPHGIYTECTRAKIGKTMQNEKIYNIDCTLFVLRESHKGIVIGKNGQMLKKIGTYAREDLEKILDIKVNLSLWVKVREDWINDARLIKKFKLDKKD